MEKLFKAIFTIILIIGFVILLDHNLQVRARGLCLQQQKAVVAQLKTKNGSSQLRPQCDWQGGFLAQQCDVNAQTCWCVDMAGHAITGTQTAKLKGQPNACHLSWFEQMLSAWQQTPKQTTSSITTLAKVKVVKQ